jgi:hypothetical protein
MKRFGGQGRRLSYAGPPGLIDGCLSRTYSPVRMESQISLTMHPLILAARRPGGIASAD